MFIKNLAFLVVLTLILPQICLFPAGGSSAAEFAQTYRLDGEGRFYTAAKETLALTYRITWRVADASRFNYTSGGDMQRAQARLHDVAVSLLRERIARLKPDSVHALMAETLAEMDVTGDVRLGAWEVLDGMLDKFNDYAHELGIEAVAWRLEYLAH